MKIDFTAHNIRLDNGKLTNPPKPFDANTMDTDPLFLSSNRLLNLVYPGDKSHLRLADLGCLEGGYSVEFARMGFSVLGVEVRESNIACCRYVKDNTNLPNLNFVKDDALNIANHGIFDVMFCSGLLYHLDRPNRFLETLSSITSKVLILNTHFSTDNVSRQFNLSDLQENEGIQGRWFSEFPNEKDFANRESHKWSSWENKSSFWIKREYLLQAIKDAGFNVVMEQFDNLSPTIVDSMTKADGYYNKFDRSTFVGIKSS
ncbi:MAG: class I SAM-dependent methyltransferase [Desulfuromonadales bacterium]|nr:class I SAM-dependent methyltransferase [Desulfuromonadales bacterium]